MREERNKIGKNFSLGKVLGRTHLQLLPILIEKNTLMLTHIDIFFNQTCLIFLKLKEVSFLGVNTLRSGLDLLFPAKKLRGGSIRVEASRPGEDEAKNKRGNAVIYYDGQELHALDTIVTRELCQVANLLKMINAITGREQLTKDDGL